MAARVLAVDRALPRFIGGLRARPRLARAMNYSLCAGGKRLRPALMCAAYETFGGDSGEILPAACAIEMVHTYSLIHDDLPAMDDAALRRGRPANHKVYGEAAALLAGDALLTDAFTVMLSAKYPPRVKAPRLLRAAAILAGRAGAAGMVSGQAADLEAEGFLDRAPAARRGRALRLLSYIHRRKTACLITAAVEMGAALAGAPEKDFRALSAFGRDLGLCFQAADDILDVSGDRKKLGKNASDARNRKLTYAALLGMEEARRRAGALLRSALRSLARVKGRDKPRALLADLAGLVLRREN